MFCPYCANEQTKVLDSRVAEHTVKRRRECFGCSKRFTTFEKPEMDIVVIKKDGSREKFNLDKIRRGVQQACQKLNIPEEKIDLLVERVERKVRNMDSMEVHTSKIGRLVLNELKKIDKVAYLRFALVHKHFEDVTHFRKEIKTLVR